MLSVPGTCWCERPAGSNTPQSTLMTALSTELTAPEPSNPPSNIYPGIETSPRLFTPAQPSKLTIHSIEVLYNIYIYVAEFII